MGSGAVPPPEPPGRPIHPRDRAAISCDTAFIDGILTAPTYRERGAGSGILRGLSAALVVCKRVLRCVACAVGVDDCCT